MWNHCAWSSDSSSCTLTRPSGKTHVMFIRTLNRTSGAYQTRQNVNAVGYCHPPQSSLHRQRCCCNTKDTCNPASCFPIPALDISCRTQCSRCRSCFHGWSAYRSTGTNEAQLASSKPHYSLPHKPEALRQTPLKTPANPKQSTTHTSRPDDRPSPVPHKQVFLILHSI